MSGQPDSTNRNPNSGTTPADDLEDAKDAVATDEEAPASPGDAAGADEDGEEPSPRSDPPPTSH